MHKHTVCTLDMAYIFFLSNQTPSAVFVLTVRLATISPKYVFYFYYSEQSSVLGIVL